MKAKGKTDMTVASITKNGCQNGSARSAHGVKLKVVSVAERDRLRIPAYRYILP